MNDTQPVWWSILDTVSGVVVGALGILGAVFGWLSNRFSHIEKRMVQMDRDWDERNRVSEQNIVKLEAYHLSNTHRLDSIEIAAKEINAKQDKLIEHLIRRRK